VLGTVEHRSLAVESLGDPRAQQDDTGNADESSDAEYTRATPMLSAIILLTIRKFDAPPCDEVADKDGDSSGECPDHFRRHFTYFPATARQT